MIVGAPLEVDIMKDGESTVRPKPKSDPKKQENSANDPRDDFRGRLMRHRNRLGSFDALDTAQPPRKIVHKH